MKLLIVLLTKELPINEDSKGAVSHLPKELKTNILQLIALPSTPENSNKWRIKCCCWKIR
jgi:hypothetical protein